MRRLYSLFTSVVVLCAYTSAGPTLAQDQQQRKYGWIDLGTGKSVVIPVVPENSHLVNASDPNHAAGRNGNKYAYVLLPAQTGGGTSVGAQTSEQPGSQSGTQASSSAGTTGQNYGWVDEKTGQPVVTPILPENSHRDHRSDPNHASGPNGKHYAFVPLATDTVGGTPAGTDFNTQASTPAGAPEGTQDNKKYGWLEIKTGKLVVTPIVPENSHLDNASDPYLATGSNGKKYAYVLLLGATAAATAAAAQQQESAEQKKYVWVDVQTGKQVVTPIVPENSRLDNPGDPYYATSLDGTKYAYALLLGATAAGTAAAAAEGTVQRKFAWVDVETDKPVATPIVPENSRLNRAGDPYLATSRDGKQYAYVLLAGATAAATAAAAAEGTQQRKYGWVDVQTHKPIATPVVPENSNLDNASAPYLATGSNGKKYAFVLLPAGSIVATPEGTQERKVGWVDVQTGELVATAIVPENSHLENANDPFIAVGGNGKRYAYVVLGAGATAVPARGRQQLSATAAVRSKQDFSGKKILIGLALFCGIATAIAVPVAISCASHGSSPSFAQHLQLFNVLLKGHENDRRFQQIILSQDSVLLHSYESNPYAWGTLLNKLRTASSLFQH